MAMTMAYARSTDTRLSEEQRQAEAEKMMSLSAEDQRPGEQGAGREPERDRGRDDHSATSPSWSEAGYLIPEDFPYPMPGLAQKGFAAAAPAHAKPCKR